jgi:pimeloyl-ACP methyl ester carboxylesterase
MKTIVDGNVNLCTEAFGKPENPALLLIMGAGCSMLWWEEPFCEIMADKGFFVIRYDNRDTGKSTSYKFGEPGYTFEELSDDAIRILDGYNINKSFVMGMSMGGMLTQMLALRNPNRLNGIILLSTMYFAEGADQLPYSSDEVNSFFETPFSSNNFNEIVEHTVLQWSITAKSKRPHNDDNIRKISRRDIQRAINYESRNNHAVAKVTGDELTRIAEIKIPTLVIHGTEDVVIPYIHGKMLAKTIPNAVLCTIDGAGHEIHPNDYNFIAENIVNRFL